MEAVIGEWKRLSAEELIAKKDAIEAEIMNNNAVLEQGEVGMHGRLVDSEGFPRADIDVFAVRTARHQIICLRNDHKAVMKLIEQKLHEIHSEARRRKPESGSEGGGVPRAALPGTFARVSMVAEGSPSALAGLQVRDSIAEFGSVTAANFTGLRSVGEVVQHSVGRPVRITVIRRGEDRPLFLSLIPRSWAGQGLLGCVLVPL